MLAILGIEQPKEMTAESLLSRSGRGRFVNERLFLVRHDETVQNVAGIAQGGATACCRMR